MVNSAVKIEGGRGSTALSLHCKDREFTASFDALPNTCAIEYPLYFSDVHS